MNSRALQQSVRNAYGFPSMHALLRGACMLAYNGHFCDTD